MPISQGFDAFFETSCFFYVAVSNEVIILLPRVDLVIKIKSSAIVRFVNGLR